jgi:predicted TIM-barrel fold metal-dependent hydrolase
VLYPSIALEGAKIYTEERELQLACVRACVQRVDRRVLRRQRRPSERPGDRADHRVDDAMAEVETALVLGLRGFILSRFPNGSYDPDPDDDRFWSLVAESGLPAAVHLGSFIRPRVDKFPDMRGSTIMALAGMSKAGSSAIEMSCNLIFSGIFERIPDLKVLLVESGIGWIPSLLEGLDDMFLRYRWATEFVGQMQALPSELFARNIWTTFITDRVGLENLHRINVGHAMWSTDYPHDTCDWPNTRAVIEHQFRGVGLEDVRRMVHANAAELYQLDC